MEKGAKIEMKEHAEASTISYQRLHMAARAGRVNPYDWDLQTGAFTMDDHAYVLRGNGAAVRLKRRSFEDLIHPDDREKLSKIFQAGLKEKGLTIETEYRLRTKSGDYRWFTDRGAVVEWDDGGEPRRISGILFDGGRGRMAVEAPEERVAEALAALRQSEDEKNAIIVALRDLVSIHYLDPQLRVIWTNRDLFKDMKMKRGQGPSDYCYALLHGRTEPCVVCPAVNALRNGELEEIEYRLDDGRYFLSRANPIKNSTGAILGLIQIVLNITEHKLTEEGLKTTYEFLQSLLENSPTPIIVTRRDGNVDIINRAWEEIVGIRRDQATGRSLADILPADTAEKLTRINKKILESGVPIEMEGLFDCPGGLRNFHTISFAIQDATGQKAAVGSIWIDITEHKRAARELTKREAELGRKSRQLGEMNTALRVLLRQRNEDQEELEARIVSNVKELILPYVDTLKKMHLNEAQMSYLEIIEAHLSDIVAPFLRHVVSHYPHMTPKELQVAVLVREGKANKTIADLMSVSVNAVEIHRYNLRKKLGLQNKKVNLRSYLLSINKLTG